MFYTTTNNNVLNKRNWIMIIFQVLIVIDLPHFHTKNHNKNEKNKKN
jgi:preprotein translocase subunit SecG